MYLLACLLFGMLEHIGPNDRPLQHLYFDELAPQVGEHVAATQ